MSVRLEVGRDAGALVATLDYWSTRRDTPRYGGYKTDRASTIKELTPPIQQYRARPVP